MHRGSNPNDTPTGGEVNSQDGAVMFQSGTDDRFLSSVNILIFTVPPDFAGRARNGVCSLQERATNLRHRILTAFALFVLPFAAARAAEVPQIGQPAPEFSLPSQEGGPVSLKDFRGQWVVLYFYPKDMTPGCTIEAHNFQRDLAKYEQ